MHQSLTHTLDELGPAPSPRVVIIILSWDSIQDTLSCLNAARRSDYPNSQILVVDNANQADLATILARNYPDVHLLQHGTNLGYAEGNNTGLRWALEQGAEFILLLNDDISIEPSTCRVLVAEAARHPTLAAVGGKIRPTGKPNLLWSAGEPFPRQEMIVQDKGQFDIPRPVRYAVGGCILLSRNALLKIGLFDEGFFMVHEEKEWCSRAAQAGLQTWYTPDAVAWHDLEHSFTSRWSAAYHYLYVRNNLYFWQKGSPGASGWQRIQQALAAWWQEIVLIRRTGYQPVPRAWAASVGAVDFLLGRLGPPPRRL